MKVIKIGGGSLKEKEDIAHVLQLIAGRGGGHIFVISALSGVTDTLFDSMLKALADESRIPGTINHLRNKHMLLARYLISDNHALKDLSHDLNKSLNELERYYYGLNFTREITPRLRDVIASFGERLAVKLLTWALSSRGIQATYRMPHRIGLLTDGKFGDATANLSKSAQNLQQNLRPLIRKKVILFIPGFFGISEEGDITTFGRGGSDYSAAIVAAAMDAEGLEIWKDVEGFMSADPKIVPDARLIPLLSYEEAAELAYFGAKILHPRTIEPARKIGLDIAIRNTENPDAQGSLITSRSTMSKTVVKSVSYDKDVGILKIHGSGVGARPGILASIAYQLTKREINIKSVITSQTCISLLLSRNDLEIGRQTLRSLRPKPYQRLERIQDVALVSLVGEGLHQHRGIAARCFAAVADKNINLEMISFGPSRVALYFLLRNRDLAKAVRAIHSTFFSAP